MSVENNKITENKLPMGAFTGNVEVVNTKERAIEVLSMLENEKVVGFDTETKPSFKKYCLHTTALIQLGSLTDAYLIRVNKTGIFDELLAFIRNKNIIKVGVGIKDDLRGLQRLFEEPVNAQGFLELQDLAKFENREKLSLRGLAEELLSLQISKRQRLSDWEANTFSDAQIKYAATDAWIGLKIFYAFLQGKPTRKFLKQNYQINFIDDFVRHTYDNHTTLS